MCSNQLLLHTGRLRLGADQPLAEGRLAQAGVVLGIQAVIVEFETQGFELASGDAYGRDLWLLGIERCKLAMIENRIERQG